MLKLNPKKFLIREPTIYDIRGNASFERRQEIINNRLMLQPKFAVKGGNSKTNPYKIHFDIALAERRDQIEKFQNSILWSPRYTPWHFKFLFVYPVIMIAFFLFYLRNIALPRRLLYLKRRYGITSPELEEKGWLEDWEEDEELEDDDPFKETYTKWTMKDMQNFEKDAEKGMNKMRGDKQIPKDPESRSSVRSINLHNKIQDKLDELYDQKKKLGHKIA